MYKQLLPLLLLTLFSGWAMAIQPEKRTHLFAIKGSDSLYLDHYIAPIEGKRPFMIFVFGGGFVGGARDKKSDIPYFHFLTKNGYDVVSIDYRLGMRGIKSPGLIDFLKAFQRTINIAVEDLFSATRYILDHAEEWNIDPTMITASGSSAGAITVLQAENNLCNRTEIAKILPKKFNYAGIISFAGAIFSLKGAPQWSAPSAPIMLFHGSADNQVPYGKMAVLGIGFYGSKYIAQELENQQNPYWFYTVEYEDHSMAGKPMRENLQEILIFLNEYVKDKKQLMQTTRIIDKSIPQRRTFFLPTDYIHSNYSD